VEQTSDDGKVEVVQCNSDQWEFVVLFRPVLDRIYELRNSDVTTGVLILNPE